MSASNRAEATGGTEETQDWRGSAAQACLDEAQALRRHLALGQPRVQRVEQMLLKRIAACEECRRRTLREKEQLLRKVTERLAVQLLPVLDNLERALEALRQGQEGQTVQSGLELVHRQLCDELTQLGVTPIEAMRMFDPAFHDAVLQRPSTEPKGAIIETYQRGHRMGAKVIRYARVAVSGGPPSP